MRDPKRLYNFYNELQTIHITYFSDWRFGQLMANFFAWLSDKKKMDKYFPEEDKMLEYIKEYAESFGEKS